jgi:hypothetical protein
VGDEKAKAGDRARRERERERVRGVEHSSYLGANLDDLLLL